MKTWWAPILLMLVSLPLAAAPERVADVLQDIKAHGYASPMSAAARLTASTDATNANAPAELRRRYYAALFRLSIPGSNAALRQQALDGLEALPHESCKPCRAQWLLGKAYTDTMAHRLPSARANLEQATALVAADDRETRLHLILARIRLARAQGDLTAAVGLAVDGLELARQLDNNATHVEITILLGVLNAQLGNLDRAEATLREAASEARDVGFTAALAATRLNQGYLYAQRNQHARQAQALRDALSIAQRTPGLAHIEVNARANLSDYHLEQGDYATAAREARLAFATAQSINDLNGESLALSNVGIALSRMGRIDEGVAALRQAIELAHQANDLFATADINQELVKVLQSAGRDREALLALQAFETVNAKITRQARDRTVLALQAKYDAERRQQEIERLSSQTQLHQATTSARLWKQRLWATLSAVTVLLALLMLYRLRRARRANRQLTEDMASLSRQSSLDDLTGVYNRRHFAQLMAPCGNDGSARAGLVMIDIDHFKQINDSLGHDAGDTVLVEVARRLMAFRREGQHVVRWGGEEFVLVVPGATPQQLPALARRLLDSVATKPVRIGRHLLDVTVSAGCVVHPLEPGSSWKAALRLADSAMYRAKRHGRNRAACVTVTRNDSAHRMTDDDPSTTLRDDTLRFIEVAGPQQRPVAVAAD